MSENQIPAGIDDHEQPRYTTRRLRYEIEQAVMAERNACADKAKALADGYKANGAPQAALGAYQAAKEIRAIVTPPNLPTREEGNA